MGNSRYEITMENYKEASPILFASTKEINIDLSAFSVYTGAIKIKNMGEGELEGRIFSRRGFAQFTPNRWKNNEQVILYRIDTVQMVWGKEYDDSWLIESNGGEQEVVVHIKITNPVLTVNEHQILKTMDDFNRLAKNSWNDAKIIFFSSLFSTWLEQNQYLEWKRIYTQLSITPHKDWALEYFLRLIGYKQSPHLWIPEQRVNINIFSSERKPLYRKMIIRKKGWGLIELQFETDVSWIQLSKTRFHYEDFKAEELMVNYEILPDQIRNKKAFGYIHILHGDRKMTYEVQITKKELIEINFSKKSYQQEDEGFLVVENKTGEDAMIQIRSKDPWVQFEVKKYLIGEKAEIPFRVQLTGWDKWGLGKRPYFETTIEVLSTTKKYKFKENLMTKIHIVS